MLSFVRRAVDDYKMIEAGDRIAVGISGGKDSLTLLVALAALRRFYPKPFEVVAIAVDLGFEGTDYAGVIALCERLGVPFHRVPTDIGRIIFELRQEKNPCSLCAKMRRGSLNAAARELGCNRVALGHHFDDAVETFLLNLFYEGRLGCFSPVTYLSRQELYVIRPLLYAEEKDVEYFVRHAVPPLPVMESKCPANKSTEREEMKQLLRRLEKENKGLRHRIFGAICKGELDGFRPTGRLPL
jgi:tRNA(Ile)-lysidine synthase TilS/MesJ